MAAQDTLPTYSNGYGSFNDNKSLSQEEEVYTIPQEDRMSCIIVVEEDVPCQSCCLCCTRCCARPSSRRSSISRRRRRGPSIIEVFITILMIVANLILMGVVFEMGAASTPATSEVQEGEDFQPEITSIVKRMDAMSPEVLESMTPDFDNTMSWHTSEIPTHPGVSATEGSGMTGRVKRARRVPYKKQSVEENQRVALQVPGQTYRT